MNFDSCSDRRPLHSRCTQDRLIGMSLTLPLDTKALKLFLFPDWPPSAVTTRMPLTNALDFDHREFAFTRGAQKSAYLSADVARADLSASIANK